MSRIRGPQESSVHQLFVTQRLLFVNRWKNPRGNRLSHRQVPTRSTTVCVCVCVCDGCLFIVFAMADVNNARPGTRSRYCSSYDEMRLNRRRRRRRRRNLDNNRLLHAGSHYWRLSGAEVDAENNHACGRRESASRPDSFR